MNSQLFSIGAGGMTPVADTDHELERGQRLEWRGMYQRTVYILGVWQTPIGRGPIYDCIVPPSDGEGAQRVKVESYLIKREGDPSLSHKQYYFIVEGGISEGELQRLESEERKAQEEESRRRKEADRQNDDHKQKGESMLESLRVAPAAASVAQRAVNHSDAMTDYFDVRWGDPYILAWSGSRRNSFPEMRRAAKEWGQTAALCKDGHERRENYARGRGLYLSETDRYEGAGGWIIRKLDLTYERTAACIALGKGDFAEKAMVTATNAGSTNQSL